MKLRAISNRTVLVSVIIVSLLLGSVAVAYSSQSSKSNVSSDINWNKRHETEFYGDLLHNLSRDYPNLAETYSIGHSWRERSLWCIEITSNKGNKKHKIPIGIVGNIHGNEEPSAEVVAYTANWFVKNYENNKTAEEILDNYVIYIIPLLNPDGYEQSSIYPVRENLRPMDHNDDGIVNSDPYQDINGDEVIAKVYNGSKDSKPENREFIGMESPDLDDNGIPGDDPKASNIDMNRNFNYMWDRYDPDEDPPIGAKYSTRSGPRPASEPEVKAIQDFFIRNPVYAVATVHTGIQCVLYPWCHTPKPTEEDSFMKNVSANMAKKMSETTGKGYYYKQSYHDYPTTAEMIDWTYGRLGIHSYTVEVYSGGIEPPGFAPETAFGELTCWGDEQPNATWIYRGNNTWFKNTPEAKVTDEAPPNQEKMSKGFLEAAITMIKSEPHGSGPEVPRYLKGLSVPEYIKRD